MTSPFGLVQFSIVLKYLHITKMAFLRAAFYRFELLFDALKAIVMVIVFTQIWQAIYTGRDVLAGFDLSQVIVYTCAAVTLSMLFEVNIERNIGWKVRTGDFAVEFIKPVNYFFLCFFESLGIALYTLIFAALPTVLTLYLLFDLSGIVMARLFAVLPMIILGFLLYYLACHLAAMTTFWNEDVWGIVYLRTTLLRFFAGGFIPLSFFPDALAEVNNYLPFKYMIYLPASALAGKIPESSIGEIMAMQLFWCAVLLLVDQLFWGYVVRKVTVHGG
ncbi:ABC transporter permease [Acidobacteriota bacterium]